MFLTEALNPQGLDELIKRVYKVLATNFTSIDFPVLRTVQQLESKMSELLERGQDYKLFIASIILQYWCIESCAKIYCCHANNQPKSKLTSTDYKPNTTRDAKVNVATFLSEN